MVFERLIKVFNVIMPGVDTSKVTKDTNLKTELGITSITVLLLVIGMEEEFGITFDNVKSDSFNTVGDVCEYIEARI
ncbi:MAG: acyl carrier protein [Christensenellaceae bacterium]|nr:acyl carrier protein [Christensenellaceae bacterium]